MKFEWDRAKGVLNHKKHRVSFEEAVAIWDGTCVEIENIAHSDGEFRSATVGMIDNKLYVAIWTRRGEKIRIISVRRARKNEEKAFFETI